MKRRLLAFLLAFVMTFSLVPVNAFAAESGSAEVTTPVEVAETEATEPVALLADDEEAEPVAVQAAAEHVISIGFTQYEESPSNLGVGDQFGDAFTITTVSASLASPADAARKRT